MNVLLATPLYPPDHGGPATDAVLLHTRLPSFGITTTVLSFGTVRHLPTGIRHLVYAYTLFKLAREVDCIVAMDTFSVCLPAACVAKILSKKFVIRVPGDFAWEQAIQRFGVTDSIEVFQEKRYGFSVELLRTLQTWATRRADLVVACSDFFKGIVATWKIKPEKLIRIYLGTDLNEQFTIPSTLPNGKILFSLGRFVPWKGFAMLIELIKELPPECHLVIAGDGPERRNLEKKVQDLGITDRVTFTGILPHPEVLGWLRKSQAFVLNTSFESFSFQLLEAMASGTPVISTTAGSVPELLRNSTDGILCEPDNKEAFKKAILSIESEPAVWQQRTTSAQARAKEFSIEKSVRLFADELKKLCV